MKTVTLYSGYTRVLKKLNSLSLADVRRGVNLNFISKHLAVKIVETKIFMKIIFGERIKNFKKY